MTVFACISRIHPLPAMAFGLLLFCLCASSAVASGAASGVPPAMLNQSGLMMETDASAWLPFALGSSEWEKEAPANRSAQQISLTEKLFGGTFLGALLFGYQYEGFGGADLLAMLLLLFFIVRVIRVKRRQDNRFSANRHDLGDGQRRASTNGEKQRAKVEELRPDISAGKKGADASPKDTIWSRRLRGETGEQPEVRHRPKNVQENAHAMWAALSSHKRDQEEVPSASVADGVDASSSFDVNDFLEGARTLYVRLQQSWAARKVDELAPFVSARMLELLQKQAEANPDPVPVEILLVNATLSGALSGQGSERAEVAFSVIMRTGQEEPAEIHEIWLFERGADSGGMWRLTGIRQS